MRWFFTFFCYFAMTTHVVSCLWIILADFDPNKEKSWIYEYANYDTDEQVTRPDIYMTSFYFTITTITTVGYGDLSANTLNEKFICVFMMLAGVIAFSMASGALTNYIAQ